MVTDPVPTTLEKIEPDRLPKKPEAMTATLAGPPRARPSIASASFRKKSAAPVATSSAARIRKPMIVSPTTRVTTPSIASPENTLNAMVRDSVVGGPQNMPGMQEA